MNSRISALIKQIDELNEADRHEEIYERLKRPDGNYSAVHPEILWRFARALRYLIFTKGKSDKPSRKRWLEEGLTVMKMAAEKYPEDCYCNTWYAVILSLESVELGKKRRIELAYVIREYLDKAYEIDSKYFVLLHCLGAWCYEIAQLNKFEREMAAIFFAKPPDSSYEEALRYYLESYEAFTAARIAQCYDKLKNREAAKKWAEKAVSMVGRDEEVREAQEECRKILKSYH